MEDKDITIENRSRIEKLEQFKHNLEKKLYAAIAIATVLGFSTIISGVWVRSLALDLSDLILKTSRLEKKLSDWQKNATNTITQLDEKKIQLSRELKLQSDQSMEDMGLKFKELSDQYERQLEKLFQDRKKIIAKIGSRDILKELNNGSYILKVKALWIQNAKGNIAVAISSDNGGDGFVRVNSETCKIRYILKLSGNRPQGHYFNNDGKRVLSLGVYSNDNIGFARFRDMEDKVTLLELKSDSKGGRLELYSTSGKPIVYVGPSNSGNGLVNIMGVHGESIVSYYPK